MIKKFKLIKRQTEDGFVELEDHIPLGKIYAGDTDTIRTETGFNITHGKFWTKEVIDIDGCWFPTEMLEEL